MAVWWLDIYAGHTSGGLGTYAAPWSLQEMYSSSKGALMAPGDELRLTGRTDSVLFETLTNTFTTTVGVSTDNVIDFTGTIANDVTSGSQYDTLFFTSMCDAKGLFVPTYNRGASSYSLQATWWASYVPVAGTWTDVKRVIKSTSASLNAGTSGYISVLRGANGTATNPITVTSGWDTATTQNGRSLVTMPTAYSSALLFYQCSYINVNCPDLMILLQGSSTTYPQIYATNNSTVTIGGMAAPYMSSYSMYVTQNQNLNLTLEQLNNGGGYLYCTGNSGSLSVNKLGNGYYAGVLLSASDFSTVDVGWMWGQYSTNSLIYVGGAASQTVTFSKAIVTNGGYLPSSYKSGAATVVLASGIDVTNAKYGYGAAIDASSLTSDDLINASFDYSNLAILPSTALAHLGSLKGRQHFVKDLIPPTGFTGVAAAFNPDTIGGSLVVQGSTGFVEYLPRGASGNSTICEIDTVTTHNSAPTMKFTGLGTGPRTTMGYKRFSVPGVANTVVTISAWVYQTVNNVVSLKASTIAYAGGTAGTEAVSSGGAASLLSQWQKITVVATPDVDGDIEVRINATLSSGDVFYVSDITVA